jgi:hypothetical protein
MTERGKPDLSTIEPIGPVPDVDDARTEQEAGRVVDASISGAPPALVDVDADSRERGIEPRTSPEAEEQLDQLRRG